RGIHDVGRIQRRPGAGSGLLPAVTAATRPDLPGRSRRHQAGAPFDGYVRGLSNGYRGGCDYGAGGPGHIRRAGHTRQPLLARLRSTWMTGNITVTNSGWEMDTRPVEVVVISSQVAYGAVGNTATARVLTEARHRCVQVPTVLLGT